MTTDIGSGLLQGKGKAHGKFAIVVGVDHVLPKVQPAAPAPLTI